MLCGSVVNYITGIREWYQFEKKDSTNLSYVKSGNQQQFFRKPYTKTLYYQQSQKRFSAIFLLSFLLFLHLFHYSVSHSMIFSARFRVLIFGLFKRRYALEISVFSYGRPTFFFDCSHAKKHKSKQLTIVF